MHEVSSSSSELPENWIVNGHWQDSFHPLHPAPTTLGMLMWLAANVCEPRAGLLGCSDVMSGDAGCYHGYWWDATCRLQELCLWFVMVTTLNELQSCRRGNSYGDGHQTCWYLGDCECWGWGVTVRYWCVVFRHCNVSSEVRVEQWSRRVGVHSGNIETECGDWGAFHHHLHHPHPHQTVAALTLTNTLAD